MRESNKVVLSKLVGKIIFSTEGKKQDESFTIKTECGMVFDFYHEQDCCEEVYLEEIIGDLDDLIGFQVVMAEEVSNADEPVDTKAEHYDSYTWTFYRIATEHGLVVLRFLGESNGYYSEGVTVSARQQ